MHVSRSRSLVLVVGSVLLLGPVTACGSDDKPKAAAATPTASSSPTTADAATSTPASPSPDTLSTQPAKPGERLTRDNLLPTLIAAMRAKTTAHMTMDMGSSLEMQADVRWTAQGSDMKMSMSMGPTKATAILVDHVLYLKQGGGKYVKVDKSDPALGQLLDQVTSLGPESTLAMLKGAITDVRYDGSSTIDGAAVTKYQVTVDTSAIDSSSLAKIPGALGAQSGLPRTITYELSVDHEHLIRRMDLTVMNQHLTVTESDWGKPVDISAPPASQVQ